MPTNALSKLKNMFWVQEGTEDTSTEGEVKKEPVSTSTSNSKEEQIPLKVLSANIDEKSNAEATNLLQEAIKKANKEGYDYLEFSQALKTQTAYIPSEEIRFASVFSMAKTLGVSTKSLLEDIEYYQDVLAKEEANFSTFLKLQINENVTEVEKKISDIDAQINIKREELNKLTEEINALSKEKSNFEISITDSKARIEKVRINFDTALNNLKATLIEDATKIKKYLCIQD